jgi:hypothetical protein
MKMKHIPKFWWKLYFWLMVGLLIGVVFLNLDYQESMTAVDFIYYATWLFSLVGVFGLAYSKVFLHKRVWQVWLPMVIAWDIGLEIYDYIQDPTELDPLAVAFIGVFFVILIVPEYVALYLYGYRSDLLWSKK